MVKNINNKVGLNIKLFDRIGDDLGTKLKSLTKKKDIIVLGKNIINVILEKKVDIEAIEKIEKIEFKLNKKEMFLMEIYKYGEEVLKSYKRLNLTIKLMNGDTRNNNFKKHDLLDYYLENFINETYIFTDRIFRIFILIEKKAEKLKLTNQYKTLVILRKFYFEFVNNIRDLRNFHTHQIRFKDVKTNRLGAIEHFNELVKERWLKGYTELIYSKTKRNCINALKKNLSALSNNTETILIPVNKILYKNILPKI